MITRAQVLQVLEGELNALEDRDSAANALHQTLFGLIEALQLLNEGEVHPLLAPAKVKTWGKKPATVRKLRLHAIDAVAALRKAGCSAREAISLVADAHAVDPETIRIWQKTLGKHPENTDALMIKGLWVSKVQTFQWTKDALLKGVKRTGEEFKKAQIKKGNPTRAPQMVFEKGRH